MRNHHELVPLYRRSYLAGAGSVFYSVVYFWSGLEEREEEMKLAICSLMTLIALIGCDSTTYECVEVYGEVGVIQDGCLVEPVANIRIQFLAKKRYQEIDGKVISINPQSTRSDSLGRWILSVRPGEYLVHFEKISPNWIDFDYYTSVEINVPNQPKWEFTID